jgi:hypothetical protein
VIARAALLLACVTAAPAFAQGSADDVASGGALNGRWTVDLSPAGDKSYVKTMALTLQADGSVSGSFYDSDIQTGRWKAGNGRTCVSFRTTDGAGPYHTAACLTGGKVEGQTWAEHRNFLFNWNAERAQ